MVSSAIRFAAHRSRRWPTGSWSPVVTLPVFGCRVVDLEEEFQQGAVIGDRGVEDDFDGFGVRAVVTVGCVGDVPAAVAHPRGDHTGLVADQILQPPKQPPARIAF